jgi:hypothetical protein
METPRLGHEPIEMRYFADKDAFNDCADPRRGDFRWHVGEDGRRTLVLPTPIAEEARDHCAAYWTINHPNHCGASWGWDGNVESPTLTPRFTRWGCGMGTCRAGSWWRHDAPALAMVVSVRHAAGR